MRHPAIAGLPLLSFLGDVVHDFEIAAGQLYPSEADVTERWIRRQGITNPLLKFRRSATSEYNAANCFCWDIKAKYAGVHFGTVLQVVE